MKCLFKKSFLNDIKKIKDKALLEKLKDIIMKIEEVELWQNVSNIKKLKGSSKGIYYRVRLGDYRIGITIEGDIVTFVTFDKRKDIYKRFPK